jgi:hypothetical protein
MIDRNIEIDHNRVVVNPNLHDGNLVGVVLLSESRLLILIRKLDGTVEGIILGGVEYLLVDRFNQGNIILDMTITTGSAARLEDISEFFSGVDARQKFEEFNSRNLMLVQLNPSYGCYLSCICSSIELSKNWPSELHRETIKLGKP